MSVTPNMGMTLPTPTVTPGPLYATENNQAFTVLDAHDHTPGNGVPIPSVGININNTLSFNNYDATLLRSSQYINNVAPLVLPTDIRSIYSVGGDLYYNNGIGQPIQITAGAALNAASIGGIGGDYTTSGASVFYTSATLTYTFWSSSNTTGSIEAGPLTIRNNTLNSFGVTINAYPTISANYSLTLPPSLPPSGVKFLTVDASGNMANVYDVDNVTISVVSNQLVAQTVVPSGITATQLATDSVITSKIMDANVTRPKLEAVGQQTSASSGGIGLTSSTSYITINNLSVTITTTGRPVMLMIQGAAGTEGYFNDFSGGSTVDIRWFRDSSVQVAGFGYYTFVGGTAILPPGWINAIDTTAAAGVHTYEVQVKVLPGQTAGFQFCTITAYEL